jgi:hypothetical protein
MAFWADEAAAALVTTNALPVELGMLSAPPKAGLYALHAPLAVWEELGLDPASDDRPLYVGKSESSLAGRDAGVHFGYTSDSRATSVTGSSTVRRSLAALLRDSHGFRGVPRNPQKPGHFANYGLTREQDALLSEWMRDRVRLACWPLPAGCHEALKLIEKEVFRLRLPPLNLKDVVTRWKPQIEAARRVLAAEARFWPAEHQLPT